jgi:hypothetical protein
MITKKREIEAKDVKRLLLRVYRRYSSGTITEAQATKETYLLNSVLKALGGGEEQKNNITVIKPKPIGELYER